MSHKLPGRAIVRTIAVIALLLAGASAMVQETAAQPGPGGEPAPDQGPTCEVTRPDLVITSHRLGYDSRRQFPYLDVVVKNQKYQCSQPAGAFYVTHLNNDSTSVLQSVYVAGLGPGASRTIRFTNVRECGYSGTLRGTVTADPLNHVAERNERNNTYAWHHVC